MMAVCQVGALSALSALSDAIAIVSTCHGVCAPNALNHLKMPDKYINCAKCEVVENKKRFRLAIAISRSKVLVMRW